MEEEASLDSEEMEGWNCYENLLIQNPKPAIVCSILFLLLFLPSLAAFPCAYLYVYVPFNSTKYFTKTTCKIKDVTLEDGSNLWQTVGCEGGQVNCTEYLPLKTDCMKFEVYFSDRRLAVLRKNEFYLDSECYPPNLLPPCVNLSNALQPILTSCQFDCWFNTRDFRQVILDKRINDPDFFVTGTCLFVVLVLTCTILCGVVLYLTAPRENVTYFNVI